MRKEDVDRELHDALAQELLSSVDLARLAYTGLDGSPRVIPIGFHWNGERIIVCTAPTSPKVRALAARPQVALTIDAGTVGAKALLVRGSASCEVVQGVPPEYIAAAAKVMDAAQQKEFEANVRELYKEMVRISIEPEWARAYDFEAGRVPTFLRELALQNGA
jgi:hypothetical protein